MVNETVKILGEVRLERAAQDEKWGEQNHPDGTGADFYKRSADAHRLQCDEKFRRGQGTWNDILLEEVYEALAESDPAKLRVELIQVAAVATAWVEAIDRREG